MNTSSPTILVIGATGQQGSAVIRHLPRHVNVRAMTRNPESAKKLGVEVVHGDLLEPSSLVKAMRGVDAVFAVTNFWDGMARGQAPIGEEGEVRQGKNIADAAREAKVKHVVYSSVGGAYAWPSATPHARSKQVVERYMQELELPWTFLRPVFFMENWNSPFMDFGKNAKDGRVFIPIAAHRKLQMVAVDDIGRVAARVLLDRAGFLHAAFDVASEQLTTAEIAATFTRVTGKQTVSVADERAIPMVRQQSAEFAAMWTEFSERGTDAFLPGLRALVPSLTSFEQFLRATGWE